MLWPKYLTEEQKRYRMQEMPCTLQTSSPGTTTSWLDCSVRHSHLLDTSEKKDSILAFSIQTLLLLCWMAACRPLTLSICFKVLSWHPNDAYRQNTKMGLSDTTSYWRWLHNDLISNPLAWPQNPYQGCWCKPALHLGTGSRPYGLFSQFPLQCKHRSSARLLSFKNVIASSKSGAHCVNDSY